MNYAEVIATALGDRVNHWITQNEPWVAAILGYAEGVFAPGVADWESGILAGHHLLLSHGEGMAAIRSHSPNAKVGLALDCRPGRPANHRSARSTSARKSSASSADRCGWLKE